MFNNDNEAAEILDSAITRLIETALDDVDPTSESCVIYALNKIPGLDIKLVGCVDDLGEPETMPEEVYLVADYRGFLRFGCNIVSTEDGWVIDEIFCRETKREAYGMLEFLSGLPVEEDSDDEEASDANLDVTIAIADDEDDDMDIDLDDLIVVTEDEDIDILEVTDDAEIAWNSMFNESDEENEEEKKESSEDDFKPLYRI